MKTTIHCIVMTLMLTGCVSQHQQQEIAESPSFFDEEIRSRNWIDRMGEKLSFLSEDSIECQLGDPILIVKFGETNTGTVSCLEFYRRLQPAPGSEQSLKYVLLFHDYRGGAVTSITHSEEQKSVVFRIIRESAAVPNGERRKVQYALVCSRQYRMSQDIEEWLIR